MDADFGWTCQSYSHDEDDLGYNDLSCYGRKTKDPVLDKLAKEGLRLTSFAGHGVRPRLALLTGAILRACGNGGVVGYGLKPLNGLVCARTMGDVFKEAGYKIIRSGIHLGDTPELHPMGQGFDLLHRQEQQPDQEALAGQGVEADPFDNRRLTIIEEAVAFVKSNRRTPSSCSAFSHYFPHRPILTEGKSVNADYGDGSRKWTGG